MEGLWEDRGGIGDFSSINPYKTEIKLGGEEMSKWSL
jgi:hypothetical protein